MKGTTRPAVDLCLLLVAIVGAGTALLFYHSAVGEALDRAPRSSHNSEGNDVLATFVIGSIGLVCCVAALVVFLRRRRSAASPNR